MKTCFENRGPRFFFDPPPGLGRPLGRAFCQKPLCSQQQLTAEMAGLHRWSGAETLVRAVLWLASVVCFVGLPVWFSQDIYLDENALMVGSARSGLNAGQAMANIVGIMTDLTPRYAVAEGNVNVAAAALSHVISTMDLEAHAYRAPAAVGRSVAEDAWLASVCPGWANSSVTIVSSTLRALKGDAKESIVLVLTAPLVGMSHIVRVYVCKKLSNVIIWMDVHEIRMCQRARPIGTICLASQ
jgi:hypothetical protein